MDLPLVSIVVPCYNAETNLEKCLESLYRQTYPNCEIIFIDDGSTDKSLEILKRQGERIQLQTGPNKGANAARNAGLTLATGKYVKFFDADDVMMSDALAIQVEGMEKLESHQFIYGDVVDLDTQKSVFDKIHTTCEVTRDEMIYQLFSANILTGCPLHHRQFLTDNNIRFNETLLSSQEWDFHTTIAIAGGVFVYQPALIYQYRNHSDPDRINQMMKDPKVKLEQMRRKYTTSCKKIIAAYNGEVTHPPTKIEMRRRLGKLEIKLAKAKSTDKARDIRKIRSKIDPPWRLLLTDIRYFPRRYFK